MISVFYDDKCSLCSREINFYKKLAPQAPLKWLGISTSSIELKNAKVKRVDALMFLHVRDNDGMFHVGVDAFILIWRNLPYFKYINYFILLPGVYYLANLIYEKFAKYRFKNLEHCQIEFQKKK
jgi:predicted DCC family thiol-disulfide oxidoreductase YuxK|tara:strand:- start:970 stop:1341 length:372 start_codon:yes stop_codon:yes gene_type:complete